MVIDSVIHTEITASTTGRGGRLDLTLSTNNEIFDRQWPRRIVEPITAAISVYDAFMESEVQIFDGLANNIIYDPIRKIVHIQGSDYSSVLANSTIQNAFVNNTASEIAFQIARRHGFDFDITATLAMVGSYRSGDHNQMLLNSHSKFTNEWDLLTYLARSEKFELHVDGKTLVFRPYIKSRYGNEILKMQNMKSIKFNKRCAPSGKTTVVVKSWNSWLNQALSHEGEQALDPSDGDHVGTPNDRSDGFVIIRPNLSLMDTKQLSQEYLEILNELECTVDIVMPGEVSLRPHGLMTIIGSDTIFDQEYVVRSVRRCFSATRGFFQYVRGTTVSSNTMNPLLPAMS